MPEFTISQVAKIAKDLSSSDENITEAEKSLQDTEKDKKDKLDENAIIKNLYIELNSIVNAYFDETRWISGTDHVRLSEQDIVDGAKRIAGNIFYPTGWTNYAPFLDNKVVGLPTSYVGGGELNVFTNPIEEDGLTELIDFMVNGQSSPVSNDTLADLSGGYTPGSSQITVSNGGQTVGNLLLISGSGTSALVKVTGIAGTILTISEIIAPANTIIPTGSSVVEDFSGFTNNERNTLTSSNFNRVLNELSVNLLAAVTIWQTAITSQLLTLQSNADPNKISEINAASNDASNAGSIITNWQALPNTGSTGNDSKFTDNNLSILSNEVSSRSNFLITRQNQIAAAQGTITQTNTGALFGGGILRDRFETISLQINTADGPLFQYYALNATSGASVQKIDSTKQKARLFSSNIYITKLTENPTGTSDVVVEDVSNFNVSDRIVLTASGLDDIIADINSKSANTLTLSKNIPKEYTLDLKVSISKSR